MEEREGKVRGGRAGGVNGRRQMRTQLNSSLHFSSVLSSQLAHTPLITHRTQLLYSFPPLPLSSMFSFDSAPSPCSLPTFTVGQRSRSVPHRPAHFAASQHKRQGDTTHNEHDHPLTHNRWINHNQITRRLPSICAHQRLILTLALAICLILLFTSNTLISHGKKQQSEPNTPTIVLSEITPPSSSSPSSSSDSPSSPDSVPSSPPHRLERMQKEMEVERKPTPTLGVQTNKPGKRAAQEDSSSSERESESDGEGNSNRLNDVDELSNLSAADEEDQAHSTTNEQTTSSSTQTSAAASTLSSPPPTSTLASSASRSLLSSLPSEVPRYPSLISPTSTSPLTTTKPIYSRLHCIGDRGRLSDSAQHDRSCHFQNICYKPSIKQWFFYADPKETLVVLLDYGRIISDFPNQFINLRSMGRTEDAQWWRPMVVKSEAGAPAAAFIPRDTKTNLPLVNVLYHPHYPSNMGHVIGDDLFPIFNLMSSFGLLVSDAQLIVSRDCAEIFAATPYKIERCVSFMKTLLPGLTSRPYHSALNPRFISSLRSSTSISSGVAVSPLTPEQEQLVCFEHVLAGLGPWGFQQSLGKAPTWWSYHAFYLHQMNFNPDYTPKKQKIVLNIKKGKRNIANTQELLADLTVKFPQYQVESVELTTLGGWREELAYLRDVTVFITPCGGVSMSSMFLPHHASLVVVDYYSLKKKSSVGMEERLWTNLGYVRPFHYPFTIEEVELPADRRKGSFSDLRDWGEVRVNLPRMETIVRAAVSHVENFMVFGQE